MGTLRLGVIPTIAPYLLPQFFAALPQSHPGLDVQVRETITPRLIDELQTGRIDAAVVALPVKESWITSVPLGREEFVLVRPDDRGTEPPLKARDLGQERLLLLEEGHCFRDQALAVCGLDDTHAGLEGSSLSTLVQMVGAGLGVTLIPEMAITVETRRAAVSVAPFDGPRPGRDIGLVWRTTTPLHDHFQTLSQVLRDLL